MYSAVFSVYSVCIQDVFSMYSGQKSFVWLKKDPWYHFFPLKHWEVPGIRPFRGEKGLFEALKGPIALPIAVKIGP